MNRRQRFYAHLLFELQIRRAKGEAYQGLFNAVMQLRYSEFIPMRPYGNVGDRKNDGYIPSSGTFFQVYAPADPSQSLATAVSKAKRDFAGLIAHWNKTHPVRVYRFAFNDEYGGSVVPIEQALAVIAKSHGISSSVFLAKDLENEAFALSPEQFERAIDVMVPEADEIPDADYRAVAEVVNHVMRADAPTPPTGKLLTPEFQSKIKFNGLSPEVADLLRVAARQNEVVTDFFANRSGTHRQDLRDHLAELYDTARSAGLADSLKPDVVFFDILQSMIPPSVKHDRSVQNAALIVMAYYFESCDIFESPNAST